MKIPSVGDAPDEEHVGLADAAARQDVACLGSPELSGSMPL